MKEEATEPSIKPWELFLVECEDLAGLSLRSLLEQYHGWISTRYGRDAGRLEQDRPVQSRTLADTNREAMIAALFRYGGRVDKAASDLGVSTRTIYRILDIHQMRRIRAECGRANWNRAGNGMLYEESESQ